MNSYYYHYFIHTCWLIISIYWLVNIANTKQTVRKQNLRQRWVYLLALILSFDLLYRPYYLIPWLRIQVLPQNDISGVTGCVLCAMGILFAIWARYTLGRNWSGNVTIKEGHELVRTGPYSIVRHPIYTGAILALLGTACVTGQLKGFIAVIISAAGCWYKLRMEENFMKEQFPDQYPDYMKKVKMLIPFIF